MGEQSPLIPTAMKTFILKGKSGTPDIPFCLNDLIPVKQSKSYTFFELTRLVDYTHYYSDTNWNKEDYGSLYDKPENRCCDFFTIRDTGVIVIPGGAIFPTLLTGDQIF